MTTQDGESVAARPPKVGRLVPGPGPDHIALRRVSDRITVCTLVSVSVLGYAFFAYGAAWLGLRWLFRLSCVIMPPLLAWDARHSKARGMRSPFKAGFGGRARVDPWTEAKVAELMATSDYHQQVVVRRFLYAVGLAAWGVAVSFVTPHLVAPLPSGPYDLKLWLLSITAGLVLASAPARTAGCRSSFTHEPAICRTSWRRCGTRSPSTPTTSTSQADWSNDRPTAEPLVHRSARNKARAVIR